MGGGGLTYFPRVGEGVGLGGVEEVGEENIVEVHAEVVLQIEETGAMRGQPEPVQGVVHRHHPLKRGPCEENTHFSNIGQANTYCF